MAYYKLLSTKRFIDCYSVNQLVKGVVCLFVLVIYFSIFIVKQILFLFNNSNNSKKHKHYTTTTLHIDI